MGEGFMWRVFEECKKIWHKNEEIPNAKEYGDKWRRKKIAPE